MPYMVQRLYAAGDLLENVLAAHTPDPGFVALVALRDAALSALEDGRQILDSQPSNFAWADDTLVFFDSVAVHGFREPYCTLERSRRFSAEIARALRPAGFRVLSAYGVTEARPDSAVDGMHPSDDMYFVMAQLLLNVVELERAGGGVA